mmetsp:Transcript_31082/g.57427  ORF Transcript_31082/g.57427 Transcript_31082/m.57427 type:complete len:296 (+) Transcript_31082:112-999(+)
MTESLDEGHHYGKECAGHGAEQSLALQTQQHQNSEEVAHFDDVCESFRQYGIFTRRAREGQMVRIAALPESQQVMLPSWMKPGSAESQHREALMQEAEVRNQFFFDSMLRHAHVANSQDVLSDQKLEGSCPDRRWSSDDTMSKVSSVLKSIVRDWSSEGAREREHSYLPILNGFEKHVKLEKGSSPPRILVPGAGVGRLALELSSRGYEVQGNEFSLHMLLASDFLLNGGCTPLRPFVISPWLVETRNVLKASDPIRYGPWSVCNKKCSCNVEEAFYLTLNLPDSVLKKNLYTRC